MLYKYTGKQSDPSVSVKTVNQDPDKVAIYSVGMSFEGKFRYAANKWQNGFYSSIDKCVYGVPLRSDYILKVDTVTDKVTVLPEDDHIHDEAASNYELEGA